MKTSIFADRSWGDPYPVTTNSVSLSSQPGVTFDHVPAIQNANWHLPQSFHRPGLNVALFDGSVHTLSPRISEASYWGLMTRNRSDSTPWTKCSRRDSVRPADHRRDFLRIKRPQLRVQFL